MVFFVGGSRRAKLKFLMSVWQARQSGQALVEIFEKVGEKHAQNKKKMRKRENPPKEEKTEGEGGNEKHGKLVILVKCAHCARKSISPDRTSGNPFSYRK